MRTDRRISGIREARLIHWFKEVGPNLRTLGGKLKEDAKEAWADRDPIKMALYPIVAGARVIVDGPNAIVGGVLDDKLEYSSRFRTPQEAGATLKSLATFHPLRALNHAWNTLTVWPLDLAVGISGIGNGTRSRVAELLSRPSPRTSARPAFA